MRKTMMLALGAGSLAIVALQVPAAVLAKSGGRTLQLKSTTAGAGKLQKAPSSVAKRPGGITIEPKVATKPGKILNLNCHQATLSGAKQTFMPPPPSEQFCGGKVVKVPDIPQPHSPQFLWCVHCGGFPPAYGWTCVTCKPGYSWNAVEKQCCK